MRKIFVALCLLPHITFARSIFLTLQSEHLSQLRLPGDISFESTNGFCEERGLTPQPWSSPRKKKFQPKIVSLSGNSVVLEISTIAKKQDICKYKFAGYTVWNDDATFFVSIDAATKSTESQKDAAELELTTNENALYSVECVSRKDHSRACATFKDGVKKGYAAGNSSRLTVDLKRLEAQGDLRPMIDYKQRSQ